MRKGAPIAAWMPVEIEPLLSSAAVMAMKDFQRWWYISLLFRAWQNVDMPCHVANDVELLWMWAGAESRGHFEKHGAIVIRQFVQSADGQWLSNTKQLEVYANQLARIDARRDAGSKGGATTASKRAALLQQSSSSTSLSLSGDAFNSSLQDPEDWISKIRALGKWRDGDSVTAEHSFFEQVAEKGVDPAKLFEAVYRIYVATDSGKFAPKLAEVIRRWQEPLEFWGRNGTSGEHVSAAELKQQPAKDAVSKAWAKHRAIAAANGGDAPVLPERPTY